MSKILQLQEMLAEHGDDCFLWHALGLEFLKIGEILKAKQSFEKVISTDEHYVGTYYHLGKLLEQMGDKEKALAIYQEGINIARQQNNQHACSELQQAHDECVE